VEASVRIRSRFLVGTSIAALAVGLAAAPAFAHAEITPETAAAGSDQAFALVVENESSSAGTVLVQLYFPDGQEIPVLAVPDVGEWTGAPQGGPGGGPGALGDPAPGITWQRASGSPQDDPRLEFTLRMPTRTGTIQMAVVQTYSDGRVDRWIEPWPAGQPEPERPAPRVTVTAATSSTSAAAPSTSTSTTRAPATTTTEAADDSSSGSNRTLILGGLVGVGVVIGIVVAFVRRRR
jgi:uncharacterized protein YcnI